MSADSYITALDEFASAVHALGDIDELSAKQARAILDLEDNFKRLKVQADALLGHVGPDLYFLKDESGDAESEWWVFNPLSDSWHCFDVNEEGDVEYYLGQTYRSAFRGLDEGIATLIDAGSGFGVSDV